jgi:hypothetical protein
MEVSQMRKKGWKLVMRAGPLLIMLLAVTSMNAYAFLGFGNSASWKEEVLLHDGRKIIVERSQTHGGRHEIGQPLPIKDHSVTFTLPGTDKSITWEDKYSEDVGGANFNVLALHIKNEIPYIVSSPTACLEYNKWGRPNPPYVIFKYEGKEWRRIPLSEFPSELKDINLVINSYAHEKKLLSAGVVSVEMVRKFNSSLKQPELKTIIRTPLDNGMAGCVEHIRTENHRWLSIDWFSDAPNYDACVKVCERERVNSQKCPCDKLFKGGKNNGY